MASSGEISQPSYLYAGLAGETGAGRVVHHGLCRMADGSEEWEALTRGLPEAPAVRALAVHPQKREVVYAGTQHGPYRSGDRGDHWEKVELPDHGLPVWSILFHPHNPDTIWSAVRTAKSTAATMPASIGRGCQSACGFPTLPPHRVPIRQSAC